MHEIMVHFVRLLGQWPNLHLMDKISDFRATRLKEEQINVARMERSGMREWTPSLNPHSASLHTGYDGVF
jgi:hypothetical protein